MIIFAFPGYEKLADEISDKLNIERGSLEFRRFPEGESYVRINSSVKNKEVILVCGLESADQKIMALMFFASAAKEFGAKKIGLIAPYLGYMRMDKRFNEGEAITSNIFAEFLSKQIDWLATIDPHLHRHKTLEEIYSIKCYTLHATDLIVNWIKENVQNPVLIGPDEESEQWVSEIAKKVGAPFTILNKIRFGDREVEVSIPQIEEYKNLTPVLIDDMISTARTMIETVNHLKKAKMPSPVCIATHGIFVDNAYADLKNAGAKNIVTCNTIAHESNKIDVSGLFVDLFFK